MAFDWADALDSPFGRLATLPNMMGWRGNWTETDTYFKNEIVVDTTTSGSYIYTGFTASIRGGLPPSQVIGPSIWTAIGNAVTGVQTIRQGTGIKIDGSDTIPTVSNDGVITIGLDGFENIGTEQFQILDAVGVISLQQGTGIYITGGSEPVIANAGLLNIVEGAGISAIGENNITLANSGVLTVTASPGTALIISPGQNPSIENTGVIGITESTGIILEPGRPVNEPQISNAGVLTVRGRSVIVSAGAAPGDIELKMINPIPTLAFPTSNFVMVPRVLRTNQQSGVISVTQQLGTLWESVFQNGTPYDTGIFLLTTSFKLISPPASGGILTGISLFYYLQDNTQNPLVELGPYTAKGTPGANLTSDLKKSWFIAETDINVQIARNAGFRKLTGFRIQLGTLGGSTQPAVTRSCGGNGWATYFSQTTLRPFPT
jgi:hypothetical protein